MDNGNWRQRLATFIAGRNQPLTWRETSRFVASAMLSVASLWFFIVAIWGGMDWIELQRTEKLIAYRQEQQRSESLIEQAASRIGHECAVLHVPVEIVAECLSSKIGAYQKRRSVDADAEAQLEMAYWANWTFKATAVGLILSSFGLFFLLWSLRQTRTAISIDREVGHAQVRAYLGFELLVTETRVLPGIIPTAKFKIKNTGQSPARKVRHMSFMGAFEHPLVDWQGPMIEPDPENAIPTVSLGANESYTVEARADEIIGQEIFDKISGDSDSRMY